jgi:hypothetical protein
LQIVRRLRSQHHLKKRLDAVAAGCRKWSGWGTETAFAI